ncbi:chromosome partitioning protein ParA [Deinococcus knuensis]|uniref:Chromosome partitioning protein ParA n=2 Tax=Deinococcus knuensis TaxID=1837380 RepID=A0ABQ2SEG8_9DEIO|nr:chromosome partitioning protein ParA [Deinococcus knuensis]
MQPLMNVITFFNHAGGVGKSSSVRDVGFTLSTLGFRVLLIDADPQANLTDWLGVRTVERDGQVRDIELEDTLYPAVLGDDDSELALPQPVRVHGMDLIPGHLDVATIEPLLPGQLMGVLRLKEALKPLADRYDFVLIDPPPSLGQLSALAVIAADHVVVPVPASGKGLKGLQTVNVMLSRFRKANPSLKLAMILVTQYNDTTNHSRESLAQLHAQFGRLGPVSTPLTYRPALYPDSQLHGSPLPEFARRNPVTAEILTVTQQLLTALGLPLEAPAPQKAPASKAGPRKGSGTGRAAPKAAKHD